MPYAQSLRFALALRGPIPPLRARPARANALSRVPHMRAQKGYTSL